MTDVVECSLDVGVQHPRVFPVGVQPTPGVFDSVVAASAWAEPVTAGLKRGFPGWFQCILYDCLCDPVFDGGDLASTLPCFPNHLRNR